MDVKDQKIKSSQVRQQLKCESLNCCTITIESDLMSNGNYPLGLWGNPERTNNQLPLS